MNRLVTAAALAAASLAACGREGYPPATATELPLASLASSARLVSETDFVDVGSPSGRPAMWSGWGPDEMSGETSFVWGAEQSSLLVLDVVEPRTRELVARGWSYPFGDDLPQRVEVWLNGERAAIRDLSARPGAMRLMLRESFWRPGENHLELRYARVHRAAGESPWSAGWDGFRLSDPRPAEAPGPRFDDEGALVLPARTAASWTLELPGEAWVSWAASAATSGAELRVDVTVDGAARPRSVRPGAIGVRLTPRDAPRQPVTFTLRAVGGAGEVRLPEAQLLLPASDAGVGPAPSRRLADAVTPPNLVIYLIDTLRADHLGAYGYPRPTSPSIDRFAAEAVLWTDARAQASWTRPAVATILTGLLPITHGVQEIRDRLPERVETLGERLQVAGYETALFTTNANIVERFGFAQGWDHFAYLRRRSGRKSRHLESAAMNVSVFDWLARRDPSRPFLLVVHTLDPHDAYLPAEPFRLALAPDVPASVGCCEALGEIYRLSGAEAVERAALLRALYDAEIAQNDASFGDLLAELERRTGGAPTAVLLLSDHGEEFYDHGSWKHGRTLYEEQLRVPFILRLPDGSHAGTVLPGPVDQIDVVPTLLELAGLPADDDLPGTSVLAELRGGPREPRVSLAWLVRGPERLAAATLQQWKLIRREGAWIPPVGKSPYQLFALGSDAGERSDRALEWPAHRYWLKAQLRASEARYGSADGSQAVVIDRELEETLRALGYL